MQTGGTEKGLDKPGGMGIMGQRPRGERRIRIRRYKHSNDYQHIIELATLMHSESKYAHQDFDATRLYEFLHLIDGVNIQGFVADHREHGIIGFIALTLMPYMFRDGNMAHDLALYVAPAYRNTLAFAGLVRAGERWARDIGADAVMMGITAPHDPSRVARAYKKMGYAEAGLVMRKEIVA